MKPSMQHGSNDLDALDHIPTDLSAHHTASRSILLHLCERLDRLETAMIRLQEDQKEVQTVQHAVKEHQQLLQLQQQQTQQQYQDALQQQQDVQDQVTAIASQLNGYMNVMDLFQNEIQTQKGSITWLSTTLTDDHARVQDIDHRVEHQHEDYQHRFQELNLKLEEIPRTIAALQTVSSPAPSAIEAPVAPSPSYQYQRNDDKLALFQHMGRLEQARYGHQPAFLTDLAPFEIPDDMKLKIEARIRQREQSKAEADAKAAEELSQAYKRLTQLTNLTPPTGAHSARALWELQTQVNNCQHDLKKAIEWIKMSNMHLFSCCETKLEKSDLQSLRRELKAMRMRIHELENRPAQVQMVPSLHPDDQLATAMQQLHQTQALLNQNRLNITNADQLFAQKLPPKETMDNMQLRLSAAQIPEMRVSLLELSRNLNLFRHQWKKKHPHTSMNPIVKTHFDRVVAMVHDAYSVTAEEPVNLLNASRHVERVARVLASEFSMHVLQLLGATRVDPKLRSSLATTETAAAIAKYSDAFTELLEHQENANGPTTGGLLANAVKTAGNGSKDEIIQEWAASETRSIEKLTLEIGELVKHQQQMESALMEMAQFINQLHERTAALSEATATTSDDVDKSKPNQKQHVVFASSPASVDSTIVRSLNDEISQVKAQLASMQRQEQALADAMRQMEQWKRDKDKILQQQLLVTPTNNQRWMTGAPSSPSAAGSLLALKRAASTTQNETIEAIVAAATLEERPKPLTPKLDPLQIHKLTGELRKQPKAKRMQPNATSRMQARAQVLRPKSGFHPPPDDATDQEQRIQKEK